MPEVDAEFARAFGIASGSVDELRAEIAANLKLELKRKIEAKVKEQVFAALRQKALFVVPKSLVEAEMQNMMQRMAAEMREQGMKAEDVKLDPETLRAGAESRVALGLDPGRGRAHRRPRREAGAGEGARAGSRADLRAAGGRRALALRKARAARANSRRSPSSTMSSTGCFARAKVAERPTAFAELMGTRAREGDACVATWRRRVADMS